MIYTDKDNELNCLIWVHQLPKALILRSVCSGMGGQNVWWKYYFITMQFIKFNMWRFVLNFCLFYVETGHNVTTVSIYATSAICLARSTACIAYKHISNLKCLIFMSYYIRLCVFVYYGPN